MGDGGAARGRHRGRRRVALAAAGVGALHLAGDPQWTILAALLGLGLALEAGGSRALARGAVAVVLGTAAAAVQLVPAWAFLGETVRAGGLGAVDRAQWVLAPARLVELVAPGFFLGRPGTTEVAPVFQWLGGPSAPHLGLPFVPSVCAGAALAALAAACVGGSRAGRLLGVIVPALLWLALGRAAGAEQALHWVPVWGAFRYAEKLVGPLTLVLALAAALGADRLAARPRHAVAASAVGAAALAGLVLAQSAAASPFALHAGTPGVRAEAPLTTLAATAGPVRIVTPLEDPPYGGSPGLDPADRQTAALSRMGVAPFAVASGVDHFNAYTGLRPRRLRLAFEALGPDLWQTRRRFALTHVVLRQPASPAELDDARRAVEGGRLVLGDPVWRFGVWEVPHRAWAVFATEVVSAGGEAAALAEAAYARGPAQPHAWFNLGLFRVLAGDRALASRHLEEFLRHEPRGERAAQARRLLGASGR